MNGLKLSKGTQEASSNSTSNIFTNDLVKSNIKINESVAADHVANSKLLDSILKRKDLTPKEKNDFFGKICTREVSNNEAARQARQQNILFGTILLAISLVGLGIEIYRTKQEREKKALQSCQQIS